MEGFPSFSPSFSSLLPSLASGDATGVGWKGERKIEIDSESTPILRMSLPHSPSSMAEEEGSGLTAVAIDKDKNSHSAVKWAVDNLLISNSSQIILVHVRNQSLQSQDVGTSYREDGPIEAELQKFFLPYRGFCARKGIQAKEVVLHDIDVPNTLVDYIKSNSIENIVLGASSHSSFIRKFRNPDVPTSLLRSAPESCAVYVISRGKVQYSRPANQAQTPAENLDTPKVKSLKGVNSSPKLALDSPNSEQTSQSVLSLMSSGSEGTDRTSFDRISDSIKASPRTKCKLNDEIASPRISFGSDGSQTSEYSRVSESDEKSARISKSSASFSCRSQRSLEGEMRRLHNELKKATELHSIVSKEAAATKQREKELQEKEERRLEKLRRAEGTERPKTEAAMEAAQLAELLADLAAQKKELAEMKAKLEAEEEKRKLDLLAHKKSMYRRYSMNEIELATDYFEESLKIGEGGYGPVFRSMLDHTSVAIKILRPDLSQGQKQFQQEIEVLSSIRHPNLVLLVGACPEFGCLIYEYMENGSLEDRLFRKDNTPPIPWQTRFRIAAEIATGLNFLHQSKPQPLVHRDLKPGNILLDRNYVSKIGDVGLARLVPPSVADSVTQYHLTAAAGTFCYIDPEYQQTGMLGVKSDLYSFGVVLLQMITARRPVGLAIQVQQAIEKGTLQEVLDPTVPAWPMKEALLFAKLALQCCELRKKDRPDLATVLLPELKRLRDFGAEHEKIVGDPCSYNSGPEMEIHSHQVSDLMTV